MTFIKAKTVKLIFCFVFQSFEYSGTNKNVFVPDGATRHFLHRHSLHRMEPLQEPNVLLPLQGALKTIEKVFCLSTINRLCYTYFICCVVYYTVLLRTFYCQKLLSERVKKRREQAR